MNIYVHRTFIIGESGGELRWLSSLVGWRFTVQKHLQSRRGRRSSMHLYQSKEGKWEEGGEYLDHQS